MVNGLHGEVSVNVPNRVVEGTENDIDHALHPHLNMVDVRVSVIHVILLTAITINAKV